MTTADQLLTAWVAYVDTAGRTYVEHEWAPVWHGSTPTRTDHKTRPRPHEQEPCQDLGAGIH